jgi:hypothetical protein
MSGRKNKIAYFYDRVLLLPRSAVPALLTSRFARASLCSCLFAIISQPFPSLISFC